MASPFDFVKSICNTKQYLRENDETFNKEYVSFIINRALSNSQTTVYFANEINRFPDLDKVLQYDFYFHGVPKSNKYLKWTKKETDFDQELVDAVSEHFTISNKKALEYIEILGPTALNNIKELYGGKK